jgi:TIR domain
MNKPVIFISHISEEADLANGFKSAIIKDFLGMPRVFVSSDTESIGAGNNWLTSIESALAEARILLILCSSASIRRPWIQFEAGAAWMRKIPIIPICHTGFRPGELPMPLSVLRAVEASQMRGLQQIYTRIAQHLNCAVPRNGLDTLVAEIKGFEDVYAGKLSERATAPLTKHEESWQRMKDMLSDTTKYEWRGIEWLAIGGGVTEDEALEILGRHKDVVFGKGESGKRIARLQTNEA